MENRWEPPYDGERCLYVLVWIILGKMSLKEAPN